MNGDALSPDGSEASTRQRLHLQGVSRSDQGAITGTDIGADAELAELFREMAPGSWRKCDA